MTPPGHRPPKATQQDVGVERVTDERLHNLRAQFFALACESIAGTRARDSITIIDELLELRSLLAASELDARRYRARREIAASSWGDWSRMPHATKQQYSDCYDRETDAAIALAERTGEGML